MQRRIGYLMPRLLYAATRFFLLLTSLAYSTIVACGPDSAISARFGSASREPILKDLNQMKNKISRKSRIKNKEKAELVKRLVQPSIYLDYRTPIADSNVEMEEMSGL